MALSPTGRRPGRGQLWALVRLRWSMVRSGPVRFALTLVVMMTTAGAALLVVLSAQVPLGRIASSDLSMQDVFAQGAPVNRTAEVAAIIPSVLLAFLLLAVIAPLTAGGGYEIVPADQLVAFPVRPATQVRASLLLAPLNLAWYLQVVFLFVATAYAFRGPGDPSVPALVIAVFVAAATALGQAVAWVVVGVRRTRTGRLATWGLAGLLLLLGIWLAVVGLWTHVLDEAPTRAMVGVLNTAAQAQVAGWLPRTAALALGAVAFYLVAVVAATWALRRPGDTGSSGPGAAPVRRREPAGSAYRELVAVDRASVWRSPSLRRGLIVLAVLPGGIAALAGLSWTSIALLPPLVCSGAALLFGVNALSLDGSGAIWVATLPHDPQLVLRAKRRVVAEVVGFSAVLVVVCAGVRADSAPTLLDLLCVGGGALGCGALVVASCVRWSVHHPFRADLRGPRDTPAPPGTMALYSARLATVTTALGLVFSASTLTGPWQLPVLLTLALVGGAAISLRRTSRAWADPRVRARVVTTVASG